MNSRTTLLALVLDRQHHVLLLRNGAGWDVPAAEAIPSCRPMVALDRMLEADLGLERMPGPVGLQVVPGEAYATRFAFILPERPKHPKVEMRWVPLRKVWEKLTPARADEVWQLYVAAVLGGFAPKTRELDVFHFGNDPALAAKLAHCVVKGRKRATSGWLEAMEKAGETIPWPGLMSVVTDYFGIPQCVIETVEVRRVAFKDVGADVAIGEGEGDLSLADWRDGHLAYWRKEAAEIGMTFDESTLVFNEFFRVARVLGAVGPHDDGDREAERLAEAQLVAYNAKDLEAFLACYADDVEIRTLATGEVTGRGLASMREVYGKVFRDNPTLHCELQNRICTGPFAFDQEWVTGRVAGGAPIRVTAVYQVSSGKIARVWFAKRPP